MALILSIPSSFSISAGAYKTTEFEYEVADGKATITGYLGDSKDVIIPSSIGGYPVTAIGDEAFALNGFESVTISNGITHIGDSAFSLCALMKSVAIPDSVTYIGAGAFTFCTGLTELIIPKGVISIGDAAFSFCANIKSLTISEGVAEIGELAFSFCTGLETINIPASVNKIKDEAFAVCVGAKAINVDIKNTSYLSENGILFTKDKTTLLQFPGGKTGYYTVPTGVKFIANMAFSSSLIASVTLPEGVEKIGDYAFDSSENLLSVFIPSTVTYIGEEVFTDSPNVVVYAPNNAYAKQYAKEHDVLVAEDTEVIPYFTDISGHYAEEAILNMASKKIISGCSNNTYRPGKSITRAEFVALLNKLFPLETEPQVKTFSDVKEGQWYYQAITTAAGRGCISGSSDGKFHPDDPITREDACIVVIKYLNPEAQVDLSVLNKFKDSKNISSYAKDYVALMADLGIVSGNSKGDFLPRSNITRADAAIIINKVYKLISE